MTSGYRPAEARCMANAYAKVLDDDELRDVAERGGSGVPAAKATRLSEALAACALPVPADSTTTTTATTTTLVPDTTPSTSAPTSSSPTSTPDPSSTSPVGSATAGE